MQKCIFAKEALFAQPEARNAVFFVLQKRNAVFFCFTKKKCFALQKCGVFSCFFIKKTIETKHHIFAKH